MVDCYNCKNLKTIETEYRLKENRCSKYNERLLYLKSSLKEKTRLQPCKSCRSDNYELYSRIDK